MPVATKSRTSNISTKKQVKSSQSTKTGNTHSAPSKKRQAVPVISAQQRQHMIEEAAYFIAQREGFVSHSPLHYWLTAEKEIDRQLAKEAE